MHKIRKVNILNLSEYMWQNTYICIWFIDLFLKNSMYFCLFTHKTLNFMAGYLQILGDTEVCPASKKRQATICLLTSFLFFFFFLFKIVHSPLCNFFKKKHIFTSNLLFYLIYFFKKTLKLLAGFLTNINFVSIFALPVVKWGFSTSFHIWKEKYAMGVLYLGKKASHTTHVLYLEKGEGGKGF